MAIEMQGFVSPIPTSTVGEITPIPISYYQKPMRRKDVQAFGRRFLRVTTKHVSKNRTLRQIVKEVYGK